MNLTGLIMKNTPTKTTKKIQVLAKTLALALTLSGCAFSMNFEQSGELGSGQEPNPPGVVGPTAGTVSFEALYLNMVSVTGIPRTTCNTEFNTQKNSLPGTHDLGTLTAGAQASILKLAACVCRQAITVAGTPRTTLTPGLDYNKAGNALTDTEIGAMADGIMNAAWGANTNLNPDRVQTKTLLTTLVRSLVAADASPATGASTTRAAFGACTAVLGSVSSHVM
jgi:hypothetical protein